MDSPFIYDKYVTGRNFIGRKDDCNILANLLSQGEQIVIYEPPKSGKMSLIQQTLFNMRLRGHQFLIGHFSLLNIRTVSAFLTRMGTTLLRTVASTPAEYSDLISRHLDGTHFVFDQREFSDHDRIVSLNWDIDDNDISSMLELPWKIAKEKGQSIILMMDEFQNLDQTGEGERVYKALEKVLASVQGQQGAKCSLILSGSCLNAMKHIFEERRFFYRQVERVHLHDVEAKEAVEYYVKGFLSGGKVVERDLLLGAYRLFRGNLWYLNHFISICDSLSKGYIVEATLLDALDIIISIHEPRFMATMNNLTTFQVSLLRAILDGHTKFSAADVIAKYSLNSSANVKRLKDALMKKEIISFNERDEPQVIDPLFEYWVRKFYYEMK